MAEKLEGPGYSLEARSFLRNPSQDDLIELTARMDNARWTKHGNLNVATRVTARSAASTFLATDQPENVRGHKTISRSAFRSVSSMQDEYIRDRAMVVVDGYIGSHPSFRVPARLVVEAANANIAGMQDVLFFGNGSFENHAPDVTVVYTPNLAAPGYPDDRLIAVDLEAGVTRIFNSDYFGESKKAGLRLWNRIVYDRGGLGLHAGCKSIPTPAGERVFLIVGLSGTGKTTTTFTRQNGSKPVQDDFVALMPGGKIHGTENGCFAKTYALSPEYEPTIYSAVTSPGSYLENVAQRSDGALDFFDESFTQNGRAVFGMRKLGWWRDPESVIDVDCLLILNRNDNVVPAVARLDKAQAAAYFMLGETQGTAAGGKDEAGKALRIPGTNPFFPLPHGLQGNRFLELLDTHPIEVYLLNTGWVGGGEGDSGSRKIRIPESSACVKAIAEGTIEWEKDPDFGYAVAASVPGIEDAGILRPRLLYERQGRSGDYESWVRRLKRERLEFLAGFPLLGEEIISSIRQSSSTL